MSDIRANTISDASGNGPINLHKQSAAKAHINFDGTDITIQTSSLNITTVADTGIGKYTTNFINSFNSLPSATGGMTIANFAGVMRVNPSTGACQIFKAQSYSGSAYEDGTDTSIQCCGDLA